MTKRIKRGSYDESFGAVPKRLADALYAGELTWDEFAVLCWLELNVNYRTVPAVWRGTTRDMAEKMRWPHKAKHLGKVLRGLDARGWIMSMAQPRSPKPYTIQLLRAACRRADGSPEPEPAPDQRFAAFHGDSRSLDSIVGGLGDSERELLRRKV